MKQKIILFAIMISFFFGAILSFLLKINQSKEINLYTYQVGIYNEKQNALDMIQTLATYGLHGLTYIKNQQYYVMSCITLDKDQLFTHSENLKSIGIKGIEKIYLIDIGLKSDILNGDYERVLKVLSIYDT